MTLGLSADERIARARADLRMGVPVVLRGETGAVVFVSAETLTPERLSALAGFGPELTLTITARRAETLNAFVYDGDIARLKVPSHACANWIKSVSDPADDLNNPMKGPFTAIRGGDPKLHRLAIGVVKSARLLPAIVVQDIAEPALFAAEHGLTVLDAGTVDTALALSSPMNAVVNARVPITAAEKTRLHVFRPDDGGEEHYAIEIGNPSRDEPVLARLHSACFTGDVMGSLKCDCGPQLNAALAQMGEEGAGVLLYLNQEGRGIGLTNKMRAYSLQDQGFDTVEANHRLGFEDDERDFRIGASLLRKLGFSATRLMTNNPNKIKMMEQNGITVTERVPLKVGENAHNTNYLATKAAKSGHLL
ncbi:MAG: GTP cyclohydrolase II [Rhodovulum sp.]|nr:GTP cyclohydrolase II [Rhodovulum sp.]